MRQGLSRLSMLYSYRNLLISSRTGGGIESGKLGRGGFVELRCNEIGESLRKHGKTPGRVELRCNDRHDLPDRGKDLPSDRQIFP